MEPQSPTPAPPPAPPPAAPPPPGAWTQPAPPPSAWTQPQQPPAGFQPGYPPPGYGQPMPAPPPGVMWAPLARAPVSPLSKIGALFLAISGLLIGLLGALLVVVGSALTGDNSIFGSSLGSFVGAGVAFVGIVIVVIFGIQMLAGIFAWRGAGVARVLGVIYGILFGLLFVAGAVGGSDASGQSTSGGPLSWAFAIGYLYTAII